jgi:hypothetical protein
MNNIDRKGATGDISEMLCDACLARLEQWLAGETTPHEFLECLLITSEEPKLERIFCPRCTEKLYGLQASLLSPAAAKHAGRDGRAEDET